MMFNYYNSECSIKQLSSFTFLVPSMVTALPMNVEDFRFGDLPQWSGASALFSSHGLASSDNNLQFRHNESRQKPPYLSTSDSSIQKASQRVHGFTCTSFNQKRIIW